MAINKKILKIIQRCPEVEQYTLPFKEILLDNCLSFKEPVSLEKLKEFKLMEIILEANSGRMAEENINNLLNAIEKAETAYLPTSNYI